MSALLLSFAVVAVAELGDKSQLMALALATRYRAGPVLAGIATATTVVHLVSVALGAAVGNAVPADLMAVVAGVTFLGVAAWTWRGDTVSEDDERRTRWVGRSAFAVTTVVFFLAELGDKTMLATVTLATTEGWLGTWIGSTLGMVAVDALAIALGAALARRLSARDVRILATASFVLFGLLLIAEGGFGYL